MTDTIIPAHPGFNVVHFYGEAQNDSVDLTPIIAWRIDMHNGALPICALGETPSCDVNHYTGWGIVDPNGCVTLPNSSDKFYSIRDWKEHVLQQRVARRKAEAERAGIHEPPRPTLRALCGPPPAPRMTAKSNGVTYAQFIDAGWTPEALRQHGYIES